MCACVYGVCVYLLSSHAASRIVNQTSKSDREKNGGMKRGEDAALFSITSALRTNDCQHSSRIVLWGGRMHSPSVLLAFEREEVKCCAARSR
jgi:hypothetical protein